MLLKQTLMFLAKRHCKKFNKTGRGESGLVAPGIAHWREGTTLDSGVGLEPVS
jgi:hypothetical protein